MKTMSYSDSRARYAEMLTSVEQDREPVIITRSGHEPVVVMALDDYNALVESAYLLRSPVNARRLQDSIERLEAGGGIVRELPE
jgi:antitoxin YefM